MRIQIEATEQGTKVKMRKPDVILFSQTAKRYGLFNEPIRSLRELLDNAAVSAVSAVVALVSRATADREVVAPADEDEEDAAVPLNVRARRQRAVLPLPTIHAEEEC